MIAARIPDVVWLDRNSVKCKTRRTVSAPVPDILKHDPKVTMTALPTAHIGPMGLMGVGHLDPGRGGTI